MLATWEVMAEVARRHPDTEMMLCASGGGRTDHGTLRWFHEFWTSDNTDPVTRVRMQWACSHFFPPAAMAAHVTRWGGRPMEFACAVALSGRFGFDLDLDSLSDAELAVCRRAVAVARRTQDLVQQGDWCAWCRRSRATTAPVRRWRTCRRTDAARVVFGYQLDADAEATMPRESGSGAATLLRLGDLLPDAEYLVRVTDLTADAPIELGTRLGADLAGDGPDVAGVAAADRIDLGADRRRVIRPATFRPGRDRGARQVAGPLVICLDRLRVGLSPAGSPRSGRPLFARSVIRSVASASRSSASAWVRSPEATFSSRCSFTPATIASMTAWTSTPCASATWAIV